MTRNREHCNRGLNFNMSSEFQQHSSKILKGYDSSLYFPTLYSDSNSSRMFTVGNCLDLLICQVNSVQLIGWETLRYPVYKHWFLSFIRLSLVEIGVGRSESNWTCSHSIPTSPETNHSYELSSKQSMGSL